MNRVSLAAETMGGPGMRMGSSGLRWGRGRCVIGRTGMGRWWAALGGLEMGWDGVGVGWGWALGGLGVGWGLALGGPCATPKFSANGAGALHVRRNLEHGCSIRAEFWSRLLRKSPHTEHTCSIRAEFWSRAWSAQGQAPTHPNPPRHSGAHSGLADWTAQNKW